MKIWLPKYIYMYIIGHNFEIASFFYSEILQFQILATASESQHIVYEKTKVQTSIAVTTKQISAFVFATQIIQALFFVNPKS